MSAPGTTGDRVAIAKIERIRDRGCFGATYWITPEGPLIYTLRDGSEKLPAAWQDAPGVPSVPIMHRDEAAAWLRARRRVGRRNAEQEPSA